MARKSGFVYRRGGRTRETRWLSLPETRTTDAAANAATLILSLTAAELALLPFTIVRTVFFHCIRSDQTGASENFAGAVGAAVVSTEASAAGIASVPTPFSQLGSDLWFVHSILAGRFMFISGVGVEANSMHTRRDVDSRAARKVEEGQDVVFVTEADGASAGIVQYVAGRLLVKLH